MLKMLMNDAARAEWLEKVSEELHQRWPSVFQELLSRYLSVQCLVIAGKSPEIYGTLLHLATCIIVNVSIGNIVNP